MKRVYPALIFLVLAVPALAGAGEYSPDRILSFTRHLVSQNEHYRALLELRRLHAYYPEYLAPLSFLVTERYLLFRGGQFTDILRAGAGAGGPLAAAADSLFKSDAAIAMADYARLETALAAWPAGTEPFLDRCLKKRRLFSCLVRRKYGEAAGLFNEGAPAEFAAYRDLVDRARAGLIYEKKPWLAAVLGIIPGMGYVYAGDYGTGIFALLLISVDVLMTYFAFRTRNDVIGYVTGAMGCFFYAGSIAGGYLSARRFNTRLSGETGGSLAGTMRFDGDREELLERHGIGKQ